MKDPPRKDANRQRLPLWQVAGFGALSPVPHSQSCFWGAFQG